MSNDDRPIRAAEYRLYDWQHHASGGFTRALFEAMARADETNLTLLARGFPEDVQAYRAYAHKPGYWHWLEKAIERERKGS